MDLATLRSTVREYLDIESDELSDGMLDGYFRDAFTRILRKEKRWPWLETSWTFVANAGLNAYDLTSVGPDVDEIASVVSQNATRPRRLSWMGHDLAEERYGLTITTGTPVAFSQWDQKLYLWPVPSGAETIAVRGYRKPLDWIAAGSGASPDCPEEFHRLILRWGIASEYERQDDTEMAAYNRQHFEDDLMVLARSATAIPTPAPLVIGGAGRARGFGAGQPYPFP